MASKRDEIKAKLEASKAQQAPAAEFTETVDEPVNDDPTDETAGRQVAPMADETPSEPVPAGQDGDPQPPPPSEPEQAPEAVTPDTRTKRQLVAAYKLALKPIREQIKAHAKASTAKAAKKPYDDQAILTKRDHSNLVAVTEAGEAVLSAYCDAKAAVAQGGKPPTIAWLARTVPSATSQDMVRQVLALAEVDYSADANALSIEQARKAREARAASAGTSTRSASSGPRVLKNGMTREQADKKFMDLHKAGKTMAEISTALGHEGRPIRNMYYKRLGVTPNRKPRPVAQATPQPEK